MSEIESNYARVVVWHNDPRGRKLIIDKRSFKIEITHRFDEKDPESDVDDILINGSVGDVIHLLKTLGVNRVESTARLLSFEGRLAVDCVPFNARGAAEHLKTDPNPLTCFVTDITRDEILERLQRWQSERDGQ